MNRYAVIGNPIAHSKSPQIHTAFAEQEAVEIVYEKILAEENQFIEVVTSFVQQGGSGLNVTVPFKLLAYQQCAEVDQFAQAAQAVNTLRFTQDGAWLGANTDGVGLLRDLNNNLQLTLANKKILVLGAGGASRGILLPLLQENPKALYIANRTIEKAQQLANEFSNKSAVYGCGFDDLGEEQFDIILNATSTSLSNEVPPIAARSLAKNCFCYDLAYSNNDTAFIQWAKQQGVTAYSDGLGMLIEQAAESYFIWRGFRPKTSNLIHCLRHQDAC